MATSYKTITIAGDGITLDLLVWRALKRRGQGVVERMLDANPELANPGVFLPVGTVVNIPVDAPGRSPAVIGAVRLWS